ncbi:cell division protein FtsX [Arthrobacter sp. ZBG10]|uniref:ABC transporter permease n=1 Tax=Arthrobacter sp. ZBG10 TaxID=1676590 RepID=UPI0006803311|nr:ABC transporter permease [Arthrobacter sp. ZBG10]KNH15639.1 cell division protein FtsX [Arthrobacter sp. ZBG10]
MLQVALSQFRTHSRRFIAVGLAVMLAVAFLATTLMVGASTQASLGASLGESYNKADLIATPGPGNGSGPSGFSQAAVDAVAADPAVSAVYAQQTAYAYIGVNGQEIFGKVRNLAPAALEPASLESGSLPAAANQVAVDRTTADRYRLSAGQALVVATGDQRTTVSLTVSGILRASNDPFASATAQLVALSPTVGTLTANSGPDAGPAGAEGLQLVLAPGTDAAAAQASLAGVLSAAGAADPTVRTAQEEVTSQVAAMTGGQDQLTVVLLIFAAVALVVAALVVSNTFAVLVAQRTRELALLRCLGAGRRQVRNSVLLEALVVGVVASLLGVLAGTGLMAGLIGWASSQPNSTFATLAVPPSAIISGLVVGILLTLAAALVPARAATAVAPLAALRPADDASLRNTKGRVRLVLGIAALLAGVPLLVWGALEVQLVPAFGGGLLSFLGVLLSSSLFIPALVSLVGKLAAAAGVPGKLAALNAVRNPGRTSVTAAALLIGVTLVTMMMTGAATSRIAFDKALAQNYPVDMAVTAPGAGAFGGPAATQPPGAAAGFTETQLAAVGGLPGVESAAALPAVGSADLDGYPSEILALPAGQAAAILRDAGLVLEPGKIYLPEGSTPGTVTVTGTAGTANLSAVVLETRNMPPLVSTETAQQLGTPTVGQAVWLRLADPAGGTLSGDDVRTVQQQVAEALAVPESAVSGAAIERLTFNQVIDVLLLVVTALLGVAVLIALIGVANTLSLSVLERTRENSLLRALGLTKGQLRGMLALEAVLVAAVAAIMGTVLGVAYGWLGAMSALGGVVDVSPAIPWLQLLGVLAVAIIAGLLASVVPARRAARLSPVAGLATT